MMTASSVATVIISLGVKAEHTWRIWVVTMLETQVSERMKKLEAGVKELGEGLVDHCKSELKFNEDLRKELVALWKFIGRLECVNQKQKKMPAGMVS